MGSPCLDKPVLLCGTYHRTHVAGISQPYPFMTTKGCPARQHTPRTQEHMELHLHHHFDTYIDHSCSLHKATNHILHWIGTAKTMVSKKVQKC